jgi:DNA-directed RNA polymerase specialized sigma24 family protein|tara:strand:- start:17798 stop:18199 length:402 start_codon:yes stop_codon:yes gene_type:complete
MSKKKNHYLDNTRFEEVIKGYMKTPDEYEDELVSLLDILITNILMSFKFKVDFDDAKQECFMLVFKTLKNFKPTSGSAFNYFTTVIVNNLKLIYTKNKKYQKKLQDYRELMTGEYPQSSPGTKSDSPPSSSSG